MQGQRLTLLATIGGESKSKDIFATKTPTVLLQELKRDNNQVVTDHIWITPGDMAQDEPFIQFPEGTVIRFKCTVVMYRRNSDKHDDATITGIQNVEVVTNDSKKKLKKADLI